MGLLRGGRSCFEMTMGMYGGSGFEKGGSEARHVKGGKTAGIDCRKERKRQIISNDSL